MPTETFNNLPEEKRRRILDLAIEEFAGYSYKAASISNIVRKAGIAKGSFYQYFGDKKGLYSYLVEISTDQKMTLVKDLRPPENNTGLFGYMRWQFLSEVLFEIRHPELAQIAYRAFAEGVPFDDIREELRRRGTTQFFKQLITQEIVRGDVALWVDPDVAAFMMEVLFYQFGKYFIERLKLTEEDFTGNSIYENQEAQQLLTNLMDILEAGIKRDPEQRKNDLPNRDTPTPNND